MAWREEVTGAGYRVLGAGLRTQNPEPRTLKL
jgi:hypothetical protein